MKIDVFLLCFFFAGLPVQALIDIKSAGYSNAWTDLSATNAGSETDLVRIYKSRTLFSGIFGFGWCTPFEKKLAVTPDRKIAVTECGSGAVSVFASALSPAGGHDKSIETIVAAMKSDPRYKAFSADYFGQLKKLLRTDTEKRASLAQELKLNPKLNEGEVFPAEARSLGQVIVFKNSSYVLENKDSSSSVFDLGGKLVRITDKKNNFVKLTYENDLLVKIEDNFSNTYKISYNENKNVKEIITSNGFSARYTYADFNLVQSIVSKNSLAVLQWDYTYDQFHNMTGAVSQKQKISIRYNTEKDWVVGYTGEDGCDEVYQHSVETGTAAAAAKQLTLVTATCPGKKPIVTKWEVGYKKNRSDELVVHSVKKSEGGSTEVSVYDENSGRKLKQDLDGLVVEFEYYPNGLLKKRKSGYMVSELTYTKDQNNIQSSLVSHFSKGKLKGKLLTKVAYDVSGRPISVENTSGRKAVFEYDDFSRFSRVKYFESKGKKINRVFQISYVDSGDKPKEIRDAASDSVSFSYGKDGIVTAAKSAKTPLSGKVLLSEFTTATAMLEPVKKENYR